MTENDATPPVPENTPEAAPPEVDATPAVALTPAPSLEIPIPAPASTPAPRKASAGGWSWGTGRRKTAVARVRIRPGSGKFVVNTKPHDSYFNEERDRRDLMNVLQKTKTTGTIDVHVNVRGGGFTGQAGAIILGLGRALMRHDGALEPILRDNDFLTRDPRKVERKKYGQPGARKRFQFSKR